jgi:hypothetical protein
MTATSTASQIAQLVAWARRLSEAGPPVDPAERAAYQAAKADLLDRVGDPHPHHHAEDLP